MSLGIAGRRTTGQDVRNANVQAVQAVANIVRSSLGPHGLDKMLVDDIGDVVITNDGATILKQLEVKHPAAKVLIELAQLQDREVGDGTTSVVLIAAELLRRANELVKSQVHPTVVMAGFRLAMKQSISYIKDNLTIKVDTLGREALINTAKTTMNSKLIGPESVTFAEYVVAAVEAVKVTKSSGEVRVPIKAINVLKCQGQSIRESLHVDGYALPMGRSAQGMPLSVREAKIACLDIDLRKFKLQFGVQVLCTDPTQLEGIRQREMDITKERIQKVLKAGANVVLTSKGIDDLALKYFVEANAIAVRRVSKNDLRKIAKASGAEVVSALMNLEGEEFFSPDSLGSAEQVYEDRVGDNDFIFFKGLKKTSAQTLLLRGANEFMLDEVERSVHDAICAVKRVIESNFVVVGGGAVETALSIYLDDFSRTLSSKEQLAISEYAEALLTIPKILSMNAAHDATDLLSHLRRYHSASQTSQEPKKKEYKYVGLDLTNGKVRNNLKAGVLEPALSKIKSLRFATEAAISILRIDDLVELDPKQEDRPE